MMTGQYTRNKDVIKHEGFMGQLEEEKDNWLSRSTDIINLRNKP
jgi:hypothetical protein